MLCHRRKKHDDTLTPCLRCEGTYGAPVSNLPKCPTCFLPMTKPTDDDEAMLAILERTIADPPLEERRLDYGWNAVEFFAGERRDLLARIRNLQESDQLAPHFPWAVHAFPDRLQFTRK